MVPNKKRSYSKSERVPTIFTEFVASVVKEGRYVVGSYGKNAICACAWRKTDIYVAEKCACGADSGMSCKCDRHVPPSTPFPQMDMELFATPRPYLLFKVQRINSDLKMIFSCKIEQEVFDYIKEKNAFEGKELWYYTEEKKYNEFAITEYREARIFA